MLHLYNVAGGALLKEKTLKKHILSHPLPGGAKVDNFGYDDEEEEMLKKAIAMSLQE